VTQYCALLKELDEAQAEAEQRMQNGQSWYASRLLDLVEEAARTQAIADMAMPATIPTGARASDLATSERANRTDSLLAVQQECQRRRR